MTTLSIEPIVTSALLSAVPGLVHGFTTRALGSMAGQIYPAWEQARNRAALAALIGMPLVKASQIHSADVALVENGIATRLRDGASEPISSAMQLEADALITRERAVALAVAVADCAPVLVATADWIGVAHAGWEGASKRIVVAMCDAIAARGGRIGDARGVVGPAICAGGYTIDSTRAAVIRDRLGNTGSLISTRPDGLYEFDIPGEVAAQLGDAGVTRIQALGRCTEEEVDVFFSHRGEQGKAGRGLAFIGWTLSERA